MSISKKFVIIDEIMDQLEAAKSGVVPGSVSQSVVSGIQNVPSQIIQSGIPGASSSAYTTFPLSPIVKNCCLDKTYLNFEFDVNYRFGVELAVAAVDQTKYRVPFWFGLRDTASMFNQIQVLIENTSIWSTVYQREESVVAYNALPETEIRGNNQYASIEKMMNATYSPMKRVIAEFTGAAGSAAGDGNIKAGEKKGSLDINMHFKCTVDLNRITPLLSNLHYTTPHMGNLRLKVFLQEFEKCLFFCPDYGYRTFNQVTTTSNTYTDDVINAATAQPLQNQYWSFYPLSTLHSKDIPSKQIPFYYTHQSATTKGLNILAKASFNVNPNQPFMTFSGGTAEIVQTNFEIKPEEYERLTNYFASTGSVIIPTQTWSTSVFNSNELKSGSIPQSMVGNVGGYNINFITLFFHSSNAPCYFNNEYLTGFQLILDGRPINAIPYDYTNDKCIVDMTQAIIDTDHEEINHSFMDSLTFLNETDDKTYIGDTTKVASVQQLYGTGALNDSIHKASLRNPGTCMYNFSTNLPDAFHSGACILENSNRQAVIRLTATSAADNANFKEKRDEFPYFINHSVDANESTTAGFTCFCDACIVLNFDASRNTCFDGQLSWASPYVD
jgi:hypothetical protein